MTGPEILVLTTVHASDDTRIRERLIRSLGGLGRISYATRAPAPADPSGLDWLSLRGGRARRNAGALRLLMSRRFDLVILHDPETIPAGVLAHLFRSATIVFDVHEDLAGQIESKERIPDWAKPILRGLARAFYRLADKFLILTLAEAGYERLFRLPHVVFPNYPRSASFPPIRPDADGFAIYVGDVTRARGLEDAARACVEADVPLVAVGRFDPSLGESLRRIDPSIRLTGRLPNPEAIDLVSRASVGLSPLRDEPNYRSSLPTKVLEYLAMGVPVVATDLPGTREILADLEGTVLTPPGDVPAMAAAIDRAVKLRHHAGQQSSDIRRRYQWPEAEVRDFYTDLLSPGESPDPS